MADKRYSDEMVGKGGNAARPDQVREANQSLVLSLLRDGQKSRAELARATGLTQPAIGMIVQKLLDDGTVLEEAPEKLSRPSGRGRPPSYLSLNPKAHYVVGLQVGHLETHAVIADALGAEVVRLQVAPASNDRSPQIVIHQLRDAVTHLIKKAGIEWNKISRIGVVLPGLVDSKSGIVRELPFFGWEGVPFAEQLSAAIGFPVVVQETGRAGAIADYLEGAAHETTNAIVFDVGIRATMTLILDGRIIDGAHGLSGLISACQVPAGIAPLGEVDPRGATIQDMVTTKGIMARYAELSGQGHVAEQSARELVDIIASGDEHAIAALNEAGFGMAYAAAWAINLLDPEMIVFAGAPSAMPPEWQDYMVERIKAKLAPAIADEVRIAFSNLGTEGWVRGAVLTALHGADLPRHRSAAPAALKIDITRGNVDPMPIAIPIFIGNSGQANSMGQKMAQVITADLERSGLFRPIDPRAFIEDPRQMGVVPRFKDWRAISAQALVAGRVSYEPDGRLKVEFRLWDVYGETHMTGGGLSALPDQWRAIAHIISDAIYQRLTGEQGYFSSRIVYVAESGPKHKRVKRLAIVDQDGANHKYLTHGEHLVLTPRFSPTSQEITYLSYFNNRPRVYVFNLETGQQEVLGDFPGMTFAPRFSPDGNSVIMSLARNGNTDIYVMNLRTRVVRRLTNHPAIDTSPSYSPDGRFITFNSDRGGSQQIYVMNSDGTGARRISFGDGRFATPVWSPRGDLIAFTKILKGRFHIGVMRPDGSGQRLLTESFLDEGPTWSPNGRVLMYFRQKPSNRDGSGGTTYIHSIDLTGHNERRLRTPGEASKKMDKTMDHVSHLAGAGKMARNLILSALLAGGLVACASDEEIDSTSSGSYGTISGGEQPAADPAPAEEVEMTRFEDETRPSYTTSQQSLIAEAGDRVYFALDSYSLSSEARATLRRQAAWLRARPEARIVVEGHADERGTREYNLALGDARANSVRDYMTSLGISPMRIQTISYGKERPENFGDGQNLDANFGGTVTLTSNDLASLLNRIERLENSLSAMMSGGGSVSAGAEAGFDSGFSDTGNEPAVVRLSIRVDNLEHQLRQITGQIENMNYQVQQMAVALDRFTKDTDFRLRAIEQRTGGILPPPPSGAGSGAGGQTPPPNGGNGGEAGPIQTMPNPFTPADPGEDDAAGLPDSDSGGEGDSSGGVITLPIGTPQEKYSFAFSLLREKNYEGAEQAFSAFLEQHPDDALAGNAQYWLGETFYARRDFQTAASAFLKVYQDHPGGSKSAAAMLKLGLSLSSLGYNDQACQTFGELGLADGDSLIHIATGPVSDLGPDAAILTADDFNSLMDPETSHGILVAVSGGADSLALMALLADFAKENDLPIALATVDHGLRPESAAEADFVKSQAAHLGLGHETLKWARAADDTGNLSGKAREARYRLLADHALALADQWGRPVDLYVAHHLDDQAETLLMRLARGSGVDGLAAMAPKVTLRDMVGDLSWRAAQVTVRRPLLSVPKDRLVATAAKRFGEWVEDPSNQDQSRDRPKWRAAMDQLAALGLSGERLATTAYHMRRASEALDQAAEDLLFVAAQLGNWGDVYLDRNLFRAGPEEVGLRALAKLIKAVGGAAYPSRFQQLEALYGDLIADAPWQKRSLGLVMFDQGKGDRVWLYREATELPVPQSFKAEDGLIWDGRYAVLPADGYDDLTVSPLTEDLWKAAGPSSADSPPRRLRFTLPVLLSGGQPLDKGPEIRWLGWS
ncbi:tolB [Symbiodinium microadriaticum]|nr:tolB [Symbiodinium microadriaticum]